MAISLSELTGASTSGNVLNEVNSYADFLDSVPRLVNKADSSGNTDAVQTVATKQPVALPLIDGDGYLFCSGVTGNSATIPHDSSLNLTDQLEVVARLKYRSYSGADAQCIVAKWANGDFNFRFSTAGYLELFFKDSTNTSRNAASAYTVYNNNISDGDTIWVKMTVDATNTSTEVDFYTSKDNVKNEEDVTWTALGTTRTVTTSGGIASATNPVSFGAFDNSGAINDDLATGAVLKANYKAVIGGSPVLDIDFTSPRIPHGASEFECETGQVVTVNTSGNNPAKVIKKPVLRFDGVDDFMDGVLGQTVTGGYFFAAFSVNGDGGESYGHILDITSTGQDSGAAGSFTVFRSSTDNHFRLKYNNNGSVTTHRDVFDDAVGDIMLEGRMEDGSQISKVNNADEDNGTTTFSGALNAEEFVIAADHLDGTNPSIDLEYLAFFPSLSDSQADQVRSFINNRNKVFSLIDSQGYYFFDGAATDDGQVLSSSTPWNGRIVGSDNGDSDFYISQNTLDDRPTTDGYKITFADNTDHFDIPSTTQAGWQIVGTSLGTFAYKVDSDAITELNLLGNAAIADGLNYRQAGDLYGIILLPESATNRDIEEARKLLIDRGASDGASVSSFYAAWYKRRDVVEFRATMPQATDFRYAWKECTSLTSFSTQLPEVTNAQEAWYNNASLSSFTTTDLKNCSNFSGAWQFCTSLTQFPSGAKLGTEATNVNFTSAWQQSGLQSFSTPLPTASRVDYAWYNDTSLSSFTTTDIKNCSNFQSAWHNCSSLQSFPEGALLGTEATNVNFTSAWRSSGLTSFPALDLSSGNVFTHAWSYTSIASFPSSALLGTNATNTTFNEAWRNNPQLNNFSTPLPTATNIAAAWYDCTNQTSFNVDVFPEALNVSYGWSMNGPTNGLTSFSTRLPKASNIRYSWRNQTALTDFSSDVFANWNPSALSSGVFDLAWAGCTSLTAQSVENILTSIANSGKWATTTGLEGGTALSDATIDIDYNVSTGSLTAATLTAIETLNGRGWSVNINNEIIVPNILQLQPAAAYSLRSFDADADPTVVNVRRSSDGALSDFTASQVSDGTLTDWVNTDVDLVTPTLNNGGFEDGLTGWSSSNAAIDTTDFYAGSNSVKLTITGGAGAYIYKGNLQAGLSYRVGFWAKISDASKQMRVEFGNASNTEEISFSSTDWEYKEVTKSATDVGFAFARQTGSGDYTINIDNVTLTQLTADGYVTTWYDQSGSGNDSTQSTASAQPLIVENGVLVTENGEAAVSFDGASDSLEMNYNNLYGQSTLDSYYVTSTSDDQYIYPRDIGGKYGFAAALGQTNSTIHNTYGTPSLYSNGALQSISTRDDVYSSNNGYKLVTHQGADTSAWTSFLFGKYTTTDSTWDYAGKLQEMIFFNTDQSANRAAIENNINDHFNIY